MAHLSLLQFQALAAEGYTRIPLLRTLAADLETPVSAYLKLTEDAPYSYLLESVQGGELWGRYSFIGLPCSERIEVRGHDLHHWHAGRCTSTQVADPLAWLAAFHSQRRCAPCTDLPRFCGGLVGYFGYDTVRYIETSHLGKTHLPDPLGTPDILLLVSDEVVIFDNLRNTLLVVLQVDPARPNAYENAVAQLDILALQLRFGDLPDVAYPEPFTPSADLVLGSTQAQFEAAVEAVQAHIAAGDVMQVVLSQRMQMPFAGPPLQLYRTLRRINPSPYLYYFNLAAFHIVGSSPEILTRVDNGTVTVRPIAGTRPRGATPEADQALAAELLADPKERAEHLMLIDLGRNDIGRVAAPGSVRVTEQMIIERYSHVMHIVSNVTGQLRPGFSALDALRATFPAGTLSGAPKVRAMEIIDTLEPVKRGIYGGAVGYWSWLGNLDTAIAIRTAVIQNQTLYLQAGAGIVADSVPALEWQETLNKGQALLRAASLAVQTGEG